VITSTDVGCVPAPTLTRVLVRVAALWSVAIAPAPAAGIEDRYRAECFACHGEEAYTGPDRRIDSRAALLVRVRGCTRAVGGTWNEAEIAALAELLDARFYRFP